MLVWCDHCQKLETLEFSLVWPQPWSHTLNKYGPKYYFISDKWINQKLSEFSISLLGGECYFADHLWVNQKEWWKALLP